MIRIEELIKKITRIFLGIYILFISYLIFVDIRYFNFSIFKYGWIYFLIIIDILSIVTFIIKARFSSILLILGILSTGFYLFLHDYPISIVSKYYVSDIMKWIYIGLITGIILFFIDKN